MMTVPVAVSDTSILVSANGAVQTVVYEMRMHQRQRAGPRPDSRPPPPVAMILPMPGKLAEWVDTSAYPGFFKDMAKAFQPPRRSAARSRELTKSKLKVEKVGSYNATWVPALADFPRVSPLFQLAPNLNLAKYGYDQPGWSFAVFAFDTESNGPVHPIAFRFERMHDDVFVPTLHVHDGSSAEELAHYDHDIYVQCPGDCADEIGPCAKPDYSVRFERIELPESLKGTASNWYDFNQTCVRFRVKGEFPNADTWFAHPAFALRTVQAAAATATAAA